jgi:hypothetical protein
MNMKLFRVVVLMGDPCHVCGDFEYEFICAPAAQLVGAHLKTYKFEQQPTGEDFAFRVVDILQPQVSGAFHIDELALASTANPERSAY